MFLIFKFHIIDNFYVPFQDLEYNDQEPTVSIKNSELVLAKCPPTIFQFNSFLNLEACILIMLQLVTVWGSVKSWTVRQLCCRTHTCEIFDFLVLTPFLFHRLHDIMISEKKLTMVFEYCDQVLLGLYVNIFFLTNATKFLCSCKYISL